MNTEEILDDMSMTLQWAESTKETYRIVYTQYAKYHGITLQELLDEADEEEEKRIRMKHRSIKRRLLNFQQAMKQVYAPSTLNKRMNQIRQMYSFYDIELPKLAPIKNTQTETIEDIPTHEHIRKAILSTSNKKARAIIAVMASSGMGRAEIHSITIQDFINATKEYTTQQELYQIINELSHKEVVPTFHITRIKTNKPYYTFCTPEATQLTLTYLNERYFKEEIKPTDQLFNLTLHGYKGIFERINERQNWGYRNNHRFFRSHSMRKFFATTLTKAQVDFINIEFLLGHSINSTTAAYYKVDPASLKKKYMQIMNKLTFLGDIQYETIQSEEKKELNELRKKTKEQEQRLNSIEELLRQRHL